MGIEKGRDLYIGKKKRKGLMAFMEACTLKLGSQKLGKFFSIFPQFDHWGFWNHKRNCYKNGILRKIVIWPCVTKAMWIHIKSMILTLSCFIGKRERGIPVLFFSFFFGSLLIDGYFMYPKYEILGAGIWICEE